MRLLVLTNNPDRASFRMRVAIHLGILRDNGIDCEVVELPRGFWARQRLLKQAAGFDGVFLHKKRLSWLDAASLRRCARRILYDFDDAVMYRDREPERISRARFRAFGRIVRLADMVIAGNAYLGEHASRYHANVRVVPTGLDLNPYREERRRRDDGRVRLVWIGSATTLKYLAGIQPVLQDLAGRFDNLTLRMISDEYLGMASMKMERCPWSGETEAADLMTSDIGLAPLPDDPFTRGKCGFKILQYQAAGLPVVASPVGVNAQYVRDGVTGFLARDPAQWVDRLGELIVNPEMRTTLGRAGRREVEAFDVSVIGNRLCTLIAECLNQGRD
ncbi:MAG: glycosyltransferase family 4 protein [Phycisphaerales bacterium]